MSGLLPIWKQKKKKKMPPLEKEIKQKGLFCIYHGMHCREKYHLIKLSKIKRELVSKSQENKVERSTRSETSPLIESCYVNKSLSLVQVSGRLFPLILPLITGPAISFINFITGRNKTICSEPQNKDALGL